MAKEVPIPARTGKTLIVKFRVRKLGQPRELVTNGDAISFVVTRQGRSTPIISKTVDAGITVDDDGWGQLTVPPADLPHSTFDEDLDYVYDLQITDGVTGDEWTLAHGPFQIEITPQ